MISSLIRIRIDLSGDSSICCHAHMLLKLIEKKNYVNQLSQLMGIILNVKIK